MRWAWVAVLLTACGDDLPRPPQPYASEWHQWGGNPAHTGHSASAGQPLERILVDVVIDPLVPDETARGGDLIVHYQVPLVDGDDVFEMAKAGTYTPCAPSMDPTQMCRQPADLYRFASQTWSEVGYAWQGDALVEQWRVESGWTPPPGNETMFQPAIENGRVVIPAAHGGVWVLDEETGARVQSVAPFGDDANTYVVGGIAADHGYVYYNAARFDHDEPYAMPIHAWLVAVAPDGTSRVADYRTLVPGAPAADDGCYTYFDIGTPGPWPPPPNADGTPALPQAVRCGAQVPGFNSTPAAAFDGTLYVVTHAQNDEAYSYLLAVNPGTLTADWATSLRDHLHDGCGVDVPYASQGSQGEVVCRDGATPGVDPSTGMGPAAAVTDSSSSSPIALPDGGVLYGAFTGYNHERGHLVRLSSEGVFVGAYDFGWDTTPAVVGTDHVERIVLKDNHYVFQPATEVGTFFLTSLDDALEPQWQFQNTETHSCTRQSDGSLACAEDHPHGFEWCINAPAVDRDGVMYANAEDGNLYAITADGLLRDRIFLDATRGASYTPLSIDHEGRIYALNNGHMFVIGAN